jgi:hypothetical protein
VKYVWSHPQAENLLTADEKQATLDALTAALGHCTRRHDGVNALGLETPTVVSPSAIWAGMAAKPAETLGCRET